MRGPGWSTRRACRALSGRTRAVCLRASGPVARQPASASEFTQVFFLSMTGRHWNGFGSLAHLPKVSKNRWRCWITRAPQLKLGRAESCIYCDMAAVFVGLAGQSVQGPTEMFNSSFSREDQTQILTGQCFQSNTFLGQLVSVVSLEGEKLSCLLGRIGLLPNRKQCARSVDPEQPAAFTLAKRALPESWQRTLFPRSTVHWV